MTHCAPCISELTCTKVHATTTAELAAYAAQFLNVPLDDLIGRSRVTTIREYRHMLCAYLYNERRMTFRLIGEYFKKHHASVINARKQVYALCYSDPTFRDTYTKLVNFLNGL